MEVRSVFRIGGRGSAEIRRVSQKSAGVAALMATVVFAERQIATSFSGTDAGEIGSVHCAGTFYTESSTDDMVALDLAFSRASDSAS